MVSTGRATGVLPVALGDMFWIALLFPLAAVFQCVLILARGYYYFRQRSPVAAGAYAVAILTLAVTTLRRVKR
jgi:hypothetical protein